MPKFIPLFHIWVYLETQPLLGLAATFCVWEAACFIDHLARHKTFTNPTILSIVTLAVALLATHTSYAAYFTGAQYIHFLLGPATVALAIPMYANWETIRRNAVAIMTALTAGAVTASTSAMLIAHAMGAPRAVVISLGPKSVTSPIAMALAQNLGGIPSLATVFVMLTALVGLLAYPLVFKLCRIEDWRARGLGSGMAMHGLGTARMLSLNQTAGAFGGVALGITGIITAILLPVIVALLRL
jgi:predicted murein hydrolase (TIGR00659 family)